MGHAKDILFELIEKRLQLEPEQHEEIDNKIWAMFGEEWSILCSDMSGFTRRTDEFGIIHFLTLIHEMQKLMKPVLLQYEGLLLKTEADNLFVVFRDPVKALQCAIAMHQETFRYNEHRSADHQIAVCIGIGFGKVIKLGDEDCFGNEVNRAFKLGEDIAAAGETLITIDAYNHIHEKLPEYSFEQVDRQKSGPVYGYYRLISEDK